MALTEWQTIHGSWWFCRLTAFKILTTVVFHTHSVQLWKQTRREKSFINENVHNKDNYFTVNRGNTCITSMISSFAVFLKLLLRSWIFHLATITYTGALEAQKQLMKISLMTESCSCCFILMKEYLFYNMKKEKYP